MTQETQVRNPRLVAQLRRSLYAHQQEGCLPEQALGLPLLAVVLSFLSTVKASKLAIAVQAGSDHQQHQVKLERVVLACTHRDIGPLELGQFDRHRLMDSGSSDLGISIPFPQSITFNLLYWG